MILELRKLVIPVQLVLLVVMLLLALLCQVLLLVQQLVLLGMLILTRVMLVVLEGCLAWLVLMKLVMPFLKLLISIISFCTKDRNNIGTYMGTETGNDKAG